MFPSLYGSIPTRTNAAFFLLVQNDCATNKKQSSSHHAHSMSFSVDFSTSSDLENHNYLAQNQFPTFFNTPCLVIFVVLLSSPFWIVLEHTSIREVPILFCFSLGYDQWHLLPSPGWKSWGFWSFIIFHHRHLCWWLCLWCCAVSSWLRIVLRCPYRWLPESPVLSFEVAAQGIGSSPN